MKLGIVIPALNEEGSIGSIIQRALAAREHICQDALVDEVLVTVVSDGSTDRTVEIASGYKDQIRLIVFPKNRGYGAAIKEGWNQSEADLLGFLDADGTCDPRFFRTLCETLETSGADVALGCRLNTNSEMPLVRTIGNRIFAVLLSLFSDSRVRDTASGMRVVRRSSLNKLYPLPDGLHFTPAMSARAMLSEQLRIVEVDMPYKERVGESKLRVIKDGLRFLRVIVESALLYRPTRILGLLSLLLLALATLLMVQPILYYVEHRAVLEWMIYRFVSAQLLGWGAAICFCTGYLTGRISRIALDREKAPASRSMIDAFFRGAGVWIVSLLLVIAGISLVAESLYQRITTGGTYEHWSRYIVMTSFVATATLLCATRGIDYILDLLNARIQYWRGISGGGK